MNPLDPEHLTINPELVANTLVRFLQDEVIRQRGMSRVVLGLSGGVDSAVVAYLAAAAFGPENVFAFRMPYKLSSADSLAHADLVVQQLGIHVRTIEITSMVDGYACAYEPELSPQRLGNLCARCRTVILFDQSMEVAGVPLGTGNKTERLLGYYTWHADDAPPINAMGDLFKTQVWQLGEHLGVPEVILKKAPTADLVSGQTDEGDYGVSYREADVILSALIKGYSKEQVLALGVPEENFEKVQRRLKGTHWKRRMPTVAMLSDSAIGEYYLRPVDYR